MQLNPVVREVRIGKRKYVMTPVNGALGEKDIE